MSLFVKVDATPLAAALQWRRRAIRSGRTLRQLVCTAALEVAIGAHENMPYVAQSTIDTELNVFIVPRMNKRGTRPIYNRRTRLYAAARQNQGAKPWLHTNAPLAALIVNAQVNYQSVYNMRTNRRYYRPASPFKGKSRIAGRAAMTEAINRMIRARHSSTHFLQSGWIPAIRLLAPHSVNRGRARLVGPTMDGNVYERGSSIITDTGTSVSVFIENAIGMAGINGLNFNSALWLHGAPALQRAIDEEAASMVRNIQQMLARDNQKASQMMR